MFIQKELPYQFSDLEPFIDAKTMEIHFTKHHATYISNLNSAIEKLGPYEPRSKNFTNVPIETLLKSTDHLSADVQTVIRNNGGGHANHTMFWEIMTPQKGTLPSANLVAAINSKFESIEAFKEKFSNAALTRFGSGWAWLVVKPSGELDVYSTANQDSPLMQGDKPILALDVWEHAYYLNYQNKRADYITAWWNIVNWNKVSELFTGQ